MKKLLGIFFLAVAFLALEAANQQPKQVFAQDEVDQAFQCSGPQIPVGTVRSETEKFSQELVRLMFQMAQQAKSQRKAAQDFMTVDETCKADRCTSTCVVRFKQCVAQPDKGCKGDACPQEQVKAGLDAIETQYEAIQQTRKEISDMLHKSRPSPFVTTAYCNSNQCIADYGYSGCAKKCQQRTWRNQIIYNLNEVREQLQDCITPASPEGVFNPEAQFLFSCQEARLNGLLSEVQAQCFNNNFFCCTIKQ